MNNHCMRPFILVFFFSVLIACGSSQPTGNPTSCSGELTVLEQLNNINDGSLQYIGQTTVMGQYFRFRTGLNVKEIMLRVFDNSTTAMKIGIYKNHVTDDMTTNPQPITEFTVTTQGLVPDSDGALWIPLPEPFDFPITSEADQNSGFLYFVSIELIGGSVGLYLDTKHTTISRLRAGLRGGNGSGGFLATNTSQALDMGFRGEPHCISGAN